MKKRTAPQLLSLALAICLALGLALPASAAGNDGPQAVYQGDGYYITVELYGNQELDLTGPFSDGLIPFRVMEDSNYLYGFADKDGNVVLSPETLKNCGYELNILNGLGLFSDGLLRVQARTDDGWKYGYIDRNGEFVIPLIYNGAQPFVDGTAAVETEVSNTPYLGIRPSWSYIDTSGNVLLADVGGQEADGNEPSPLSEGLFFQLEEGRGAGGRIYEYEYGIFDRDGDLLTEVTTQKLFGTEALSDMTPRGGYSEGYLVLDTGWDPSVTVVDTDGDLVWDSGEEDLIAYGGDDMMLYNTGVHNGLLVMRDGGDDVVVNVETGEFLILPEEGLVIRDDFRDGLATVYDGSHSGVLDTQGNDVIPIGEFEWSSPFNEGLAIAEVGGQTYLLERHEGTYTSEQPVTVAGFTDVSASAWYAGYVETVVDKGLFSGKGEGTFGPEDSMTYAEFLVVLSQFSGESIPGAAGAWYQGYVNWAENAGLVPDGMGSFNPDASITRQDMAALFGTFLGTYDHDSSTVSSGNASFSDGGSIADYAADGVQTCYELGIMSGKDGNAFDPLGTATRAEVAVTMTQMARVMGR